MSLGLNGMMVKNQVTSDNVYVVDNDPQVLEILTGLVNEIGHRVRSYKTAEDFIANRRQLGRQPECLILDLCLPGMDGIGLQEWLKNEDIEIPIIFISGLGDIPTAVEAMKQGAIDFIEKPFKRIEILRLVQFSLGKQAKTLARRQEVEEISARLATLTEREHETLEWMVAGKTIKEIATRFQIGTRTVSKHQIGCFRKMGVDNVIQLIRLMHRME